MTQTGTAVDAPPSAEGGAAPKRPATEDRRQKWRSRRYRWDAKLSPYAFISPFFLFFAAFGLFPLLYTAWASLHRVELTAPTDMEWAGLHNYTRLFEDHFFWNSLWVTFTLAVLSTVPQLLMAMGLAHLLNYKMRAASFFRVAMLAPYATSVAAATLVFAMLYGRDYGLINWVFGLFGVDEIDWKSGDWTSKIAISTIVIWRWTGYNTLIYLAAMQAVPHDLYESAALDGASRWKQFRYVTIPSLRPTILFTVVVSTIGSVQLFGEPLLFEEGAGASGGPDHQFQTLGLYLYEQGWRNLHLGRAAAIAWVMFLILVVIGIVFGLISRRLRKS
ncbi:carbohydrate ABC transporter permease [Streptomyces aculeolatus]|jgi:cellobiose transport system permease protein